jgi:hypothetical protein
MHDIDFRVYGAAVFADEGIENTMNNAGYLNVMEIADLKNGNMAVLLLNPNELIHSK